MPAIIRRSVHTTVESRRDILHAISWQVHSSLWRPPTDVYETDENFVLRVEIAGMRDDEIDATVENNTLLIRGSRVDAPERLACYHQMEIQSGRFEVAVELPAPFDVDRAVAEYKDGFLTITLPKIIIPR